MDLRINSKSRVPVHLQLEQQIKHLIMTGSFKVGDRLPSIRAMAGFLRMPHPPRVAQRGQVWQNLLAVTRCSRRRLDIALRAIAGGSSSRTADRLVRRARSTGKAQRAQDACSIEAERGDGERSRPL